MSHTVHMYQIGIGFRRRVNLYASYMLVMWLVCLLWLLWVVVMHYGHEADSRHFASLWPQQFYACVILSFTLSGPMSVMLFYGQWSDQLNFDDRGINFLYSPPPYLLSYHMC